MENEEAVKNDFNEIAGLPDPPRWNHNNCYFGYLMQFLPERFERCLEIGCAAEFVHEPAQKRQTERGPAQCGCMGEALMFTFPSARCGGCQNRIYTTYFSGGCYIGGMCLSGENK